MKEHRKAISEMLEDLGYSVMASQALNQESDEILLGYAQLIKMEARKKNLQEILFRLKQMGLR